MTDPTSPKETTREEVLPLAEETLRVDVRENVTGRVRISTTTDVIEELARADLHRETVDVTRVPIDRPVEAPPQIRTEGDVVIVPVVEEVLVVEKRLVLREELHIRRRSETQSVEVPVELRRQRAIVERLPADETSGNANPAQE
jgi:stress response protein YsnF